LRSAHPERERERSAVPDVTSERAAYRADRHKTTDLRPPVSVSSAHASRYDTQAAAPAPRGASE
jgi:hypothetical protein